MGTADRRLGLSEAVSAGCRFLSGRQQPEGCWHDFSFYFPFDGAEVVSDEWTTGFVGSSLVETAGELRDPFSRASQWLLGRRRGPAGWGFSSRIPPDADTTANAVLFQALGHRAGLLPPPPNELAEILLGYWEPSAGGFMTYLPRGPQGQQWLLGQGRSWCDAHLSVTALASFAISHFYPEGHPLLRAAAAFVRRRQDADGSWPDFWWHGRTYSTYQAARFMRVAGEGGACAAAARWVRAMQRPDGGWGDGLGGESAAFHTALSLSTLMLDETGADDPAVEAGVSWLLRQQSADGGWQPAPILRMPRPDAHAPWANGEAAYLLPALKDGNRIFCTTMALAALTRYAGSAAAGREGMRDMTVESSSSVLENVSPPGGRELSEEWLRGVVGRATPLFERIHGPFEPAAGGEHPDDIAACLKSWREAAAGGDAELFQRRLAWDGLDLETVARYLGPVRLRPGADLPAWAVTLKEMWPQLAREEGGAARFIDPEHPEPFEEVFTPFVHAASRRLAAHLGGLPEGVEELAVVRLERQLLHKLTYVCAQALELEFSVARAQQRSPFGRLLSLAGGPRSNDLYRAFVGRMLGGGLIDFFGEYAVLARLVGTLVELWVESSAEFIRRLVEDLPRLAAEFNGGRALGRVTDLLVGMSDSHHGGRTVIKAHFENGLKLVYKPKDVEIEAAFSDLLGRLNSLGAPLPLRCLKVFNRRTHGWVEFVENIPLADEEAGGRYYKRVGMLACLLYLLWGNDAHFENVIASGEHPVLIDAETLMHPEIHSEGVEGREASFTASRQIWKSVIGTGLLPRWEFVEDRQAVDISAVGTVADQSSPVDLPFWEEINTDDMRLTFRSWMIQPQSNAPHLDGAMLTPDRFGGEVIEGCREMYRFLLEHRHRLLGPDGLLSRLRGQRVRFIYRGTWIYGFCLVRSLSPKLLRDGVARSIHLDAMSRALLRARSKPVFWPVTAAEHASLELMDIPCFAFRSDEDGMTVAPGVRLDHCFLEPSFEGAYRQVEAMCEEDMQTQLTFIRAALYTRAAVAAHLGGAKAGGSDLEGDDSRPLTAEEALSAAGEIAHQLRRHALGPADKNVTWITLRLFAQAQRYQLEQCGYNLYDGNGGVALFLAALEHVAGGAGYRDLALAAVQPLRAALHDEERERLAKALGIGGATGLGSLAYCLTAVGHLLGEESLIGEAHLAAGLITDELIGDDQALDVVSGSAGAILGLLRLWRAAPGGVALETAVRCGERLLDARVPSASGFRAWSLFQDKLLTGFSHGAAGIAYALLRLSEATGDARYREAAHEAILYERSVYSEEEGNWPDLRELPHAPDKPPFATAWCHGAPGIGLARLGGLPILATPEIRAEIAAALRTTENYDVRQETDHLCCGTLGRADFLVTAARAFGRPDLEHTARRWGAYVVTRSRKRHSFLLQTPDGVPVPGMFMGLSGIGYELLRMAHPEQVPSVLLWE